MVFEYNKDNIPSVELESEWRLEDGFTNQVFRVGDWSMELPADGNLKQVKGAIYAWIAWYDFLACNKKMLSDD
jgi:hypothetical protein